MNRTVRTIIVYALILENSAAFSRNGRCWNGFSYVVPGQHHARAEPLEVIGDKKGDWALRWLQAEPDLAELVENKSGAPCKWILVTRHPLDNIATMSLRKGRTYDRLRIAASDAADFRARLAACQARGEIPSAALDSMIDDYEGLCETLEHLQASVPPADWCGLKYERLVDRSEMVIRDVCRFLGLEADEAYVASCASIVRPSPNRSRHAVAWAPAQLRRVARLTQRFAFLRSYADDDGSDL